MAVPGAGPGGRTWGRMSGRRAGRHGAPERGRPPAPSAPAAAPATVREHPSGLPARLAALTATDPHRRRRLTRMKAGATALLGAALAAYLISFLGGSAPDGGYGVLRAASEAALVGGLADWFAVTALFRHPLGLPIPHTALIPTRKEALAVTLGEFVAENFLSPEVVLDHLTRVDLVGRAGGWLADPTHAAPIARASAVAASDLLEATGSEPIVSAVLAAVRADMHRRSYASEAGHLLRIAVDAGTHAPVVTLLLQQAVSWLEAEANEALLVDWVRRQVPFVFRLFATETRLRTMLDHLRGQVAAAVADDQHPLRAQLTGALRGAAQRLRTDRELAGRVNAAALGLVESPEVRDWLTEQVTSTLHTVHTMLTSDPASEPVGRFAALLQDWGRRATGDPGFRARVDFFVDRLVRRAFQAHAPEFAALVVETVKRWDPAETTKKIELAVGPDLQFIRLNGTVVGAVAGLAIYALGLLVR
jgi:uncharacterized membrane-anchored protein YjiN (DUF445 family)